MGVVTLDQERLRACVGRRGRGKKLSCFWSMAGPVRTIPFKYGWVAVPTKTEGDRGQRGHHLGPETYVSDRETYVIDKEARVITAHASVASTIIAKEYTRARRQGVIFGRRIWPTEA